MDELSCLQRSTSTGAPGVVTALAVLIAVSSCADDASSDSRFRPVTDTQELMASVVEPAAEVYWDAVGWIVDEDGETYIRPTTTEEWTAVQNAATLLAESGNLLLMEHHAQGREDWAAMAEALTEVSLRALDAARAEDPDRVFDMGAQVYFACTGCHGVYAIETLRPNVELDSMPSGAPGS